MAYASNRFKESRVNYGIIKPAQGIYEQSETQKAEIGFRLLVGERVFRYAKAGATGLAAGKLMKAAKFPTTELNKRIAANVAAGSYEVTVVTTAAETALEGGYMMVNDNAGEGLSYRIKSSKANAATATSTDLILFDPIITALTSAATEVELAASPYMGITLNANAADNIVGVPPIPVTASYYFWLQTWGPCACLAGGTTAVGDVLAPDGSGGVVVASVFTSNFVGNALNVGTATEYNGIYLRVAP